MKRVALLDSGPLGEIIKPQPSPDTKRWLHFVDKEKIAIRVPQIIDYEIRRNLVLEDLCATRPPSKSIRNLNKFRSTEQFIPVTPEIVLDNACDIWAKLRFNAQPTSELENIDVDAILAAQALSQKDRFDEVIIVTRNLKDIIKFAYLGIQVWDWKQALHDSIYDSITFHNTDLIKVS